MVNVCASVCMCMCVQMYVCMHVCNVCTCMYVRMYMYVCTYVYLCMFVCMYACYACIDTSHIHPSPITHTFEPHSDMHTTIPLSVHEEGLVVASFSDPQCVLSTTFQTYICTTQTHTHKNMHACTYTRMVLRVS